MAKADLLKVSVLICTYGEDRWRSLAVGRALPSAQSQREAHEVRAWHLPGGTLAEARNIAARDATGDVLCFLDADDELAPGYIAAMRHAAAQRARADATPFSSPAVMEIGGAVVEPARRPSTDALLVPAVQYVYRDVDGERHEDEPVLLNRGRPLTEINRAVIGTLVPRDLFLELGGFHDLPALEDWELWLRCSRHVPLVDVPDAVYRVFVRPQSRNADQSLYWQIRREHEAA